ncbi:PIG-L family deacetylase [Pseudonocardia sp. T1-2H]|uniref:PIG-L family deacetylase n=1 Tax=Pseudonocardia sp. T1-2H TaxID=3128899 RepID=UPI00310168F4
MTVERNLSVVAHEDDDLIFLNPAIVQGIRRGSPTRTVYVTAGEFNGNGTTREAYAGQRRDGECSAYASMAGVRTSGHEPSRSPAVTRWRAAS